MTTTQHVASVHPQTVTEYSMSPKKRRRPRQRDHAAESSEVTVTKYDDALMEHAHAVVGEDKGRIEFLPDGEIYIHNDSSWKRRRRT